MVVLLFCFGERFRSRNRIANEDSQQVEIMPLFWLACWLLIESSWCYVLQAQTVALIKNEIADTFNLVNSYGVPCDASPLSPIPCPAGDNMGALVRLVFHDSAGDGHSLNGCIDFTEPDNKGLEDVVALLNDLYMRKQYKAIISMADLIVLAGVVVIEFATTLGVPVENLDGPGFEIPTTLRLPFRYGRRDVVTCNDRGMLPSASVQLSTMQQLFHPLGWKFGTFSAKRCVHHLPQQGYFHACRICHVICGSSSQQKYTQHSTQHIHGHLCMCNWMVPRWIRVCLWARQRRVYWNDVLGRD
jgi:hypothetical protein